MFVYQESKTELSFIAHHVWVEWITTEQWQTLSPEERVELSYLVPKEYRGAKKDNNGCWWQPIAVKAWTEKDGNSYRECYEDTGFSGSDIGQYL